MTTSESQYRDATDEPSKDELFHLLSNQRRRDTLRYLADRDGPVDMRDLAEWIAARENGTTVAQLRSKERQRVYIALYQSHLPKLDDNGVIEYNQSRGIVRRTELADRFDPYLDLETDDEPTEDATMRMERTNRLPIHYGLAVVGIVLFIGGWFELVSQFLLLTLALIALFVALSWPQPTGLMNETPLAER